MAAAIKQSVLFCRNNEQERPQSADSDSCDVLSGDRAMKEEEGTAGAAGAGAGVGRLVDSSQADDRRMIRLVRARRLLYARTNMPVASYYAQVKALWQEIADNMGWTVAEVRRKWSHIRNSYSRHLRNELHGARTGRGRVVSRWYLADELDFLREHMATDTRVAPYTAYSSSFLKLNMGEAESESELQPFLSSPWLSLTAAQPPPQPPPPPLDPDDSCSSQAFQPEENGSFFQFFRGIHPDYQQLSARKQRQFQRQCLGFLHDLLDEEEAPYAHGAMNLCSSAYDSDDADKKESILVEKETIIP